MLLFQLVGNKNGGDRLLFAEQLNAGHDGRIATSYYIDSISRTDPRQALGWDLHFDLPVQGRYAQRCRSRLDISCPMGNWFVFDRQGYFATVGSIEFEFEHTGSLKENEMIQLGGKELKVVRLDISPFSRKYTFSDGRSNFELTDRGSLVEINYDKSRVVAGVYGWEPRQCDDGQTRYAFTYDCSVSLRSMGGNEHIVITAGKSYGVGDFWAEGKGVMLPFNVLATFEGHKEEELDRLSMQPYVNASTHSGIINYNLQLEIENGNIGLGVAGERNDGVNGYFFFSASTPIKSTTKIGFGSMDDGSYTELEYSASPRIYRAGQEIGQITVASSNSQFVEIEFTGQKKAHFRFLQADGQLGLSQVRAGNTDFTPAAGGGSIFTEDGVKVKSKLDLPRNTKLFFFDQSKNQFHWQSSAPFEPYKDWKFDQLEYRGKSDGREFTINPIAYPNPAREYSSVEFNWPGTQAFLELYLHDMSGRRIKPIFSGSIGSGQFRQIFDVRDLAQGSYMIQGSLVSFEPWERHSISGQGALLNIVK